MMKMNTLELTARQAGNSCVLLCVEERKKERHASTHADDESSLLRVWYVFVCVYSMHLHYSLFTGNETLAT